MILGDNKDILTFSGAVKSFTNATKIVDGLLYAPDLNIEICGGQVINDDVFMAGVLTDGCLRVRVKGVAHHLTPGDIILLFPGDIIDCQIEVANAKGGLFICSTERAIDLVKDNSLYLYTLQLRTNQVIRLPEEHYKYIAGYVSIIQSKILHKEITPLLSQTVLFLVEAGISELFEGIQALGYEQDTERISQVEKLYKEFITLLSTTPIRPREVEWYADKLRITPKYLSKICRENSGRSASEWIREYAMIDIKCHLRNSSLSIKEVAHRLGYSSLAFFGKTVKRWFGMTASELRNILRENKSTNKQ